MNDKSQIDYWFDEDCILTVPTSKVPTIGEEIYFDTRMDKDWYDVRFPNDKLYHKGISGNFIVTGIKRYYKNYDYVVEEKTNMSTYNLPSQFTVETFEVYLEKKERE